MSSDASLYEQIGGEAAVEAAVVRFYEKVMADPELARFFEKMDLPAQIDKQIAFMEMALGGPTSYSGPGLRQAHARSVDRGLNDHHFDLVATHLDATLEELGVARALIDEAMEIVGGTRDDVLNR